MRLKIFIFALIFASLGTIAAAQEPAQRVQYQPRTLSQIIKQNAQRVTDIDGGTSSYSLLNADGLPSKVIVTFAGKSRKTPPEIKEFISEWEQALSLEQEITDLFDEEVLFVEDSVEYWLPVQKAIIPTIKQRIRKGEKVELLLLWIGARKKAGKVDWVFLVNGLEKQ